MSGVAKQSAHLLEHSEGLGNTPDIIEFPALPKIPVVDSDRAAFVEELSGDVAKWILFGSTGGQAIGRGVKPSYGGKKGRHYIPGTPSALEELEAYDKQVGKMKAFRHEVKQALDNGSPIVFVSRVLTQEVNQFAGSKRGDDNTVRIEPLRLLVDRAFNPNAPTTRDFEIIKSARWLVNGSTATPFQAAESRHRRPDDEDDIGLTTQFTFKSVDVALGVRSILALIPTKQDFLMREEFRGSLIDVVGLSRFKGTTGKRRFKERCRKEFGEEFSAAQEVEVALRLSPYLNSTNFEKILALMAKLGVGVLTDESQRLVKEKFFLRKRESVKALACFSKHNPKTIGEIPSIFERMDTFETYARMGMVPFGVSKERNKIIELLGSNNVVALVDQQFYNDDLVPEIFGQKISEDSERTAGIWGRYVRGGGRVVMSLVRDIVEGASPDLQNRIIVRPQTDPRLFRSYEAAIQKMFDFDLNWSADMAVVSEVLGQLTTYCDRSLLFIDASAAKSIESLKTFVDIASGLGVKVILRSRQAIPGIPTVTLTPWSDAEVARRLKEDVIGVSRQLEIAKIPDPIFDATCARVGGFRAIHEDPLHLSLLTLELAAMRAHADRSETIHESDVAMGVTTLFRLADSQQTKRILDELDLVQNDLPQIVVGQDEAIGELLDLVRGHMSGARDPGRPLSVLLPGPTGVGKTEALSQLAKRLSLPFFPIDGTRYGEEHSYAALLGSPTGYVGPDEGPLFKFADENSVAIIFADEIDKMHSQVRRALMNLVDKGHLTAGNGRQIHKPGLIVVGATNAGQFKIYRGMSTEEVHTALADSLVDNDTKQKQPEVIKRWRVIPMPAIHEEHFKLIIKKTLESVANRPGFLTANLQLSGVRSSAVELVFKNCRSACLFNPTGTIVKAKQQRPHESNQYYDMRFVNNSVDALCLADLNRVIRQSHNDGTASSRSSRKILSLEACPEQKRLIFAAA